MKYQFYKSRAIELRLEGKTYSEILKEIPVAKSTLGEWFHEVKLATHQVQRITEKRKAAQRKGAEARRSQRIELQAKIINQADEQIKEISQRELWLIGIALYWGEGAKEKAYRTGVGLKFSNSNPEMIKLYLLWVEKCLDIPHSRIILELYIHDSCKNRQEEMINFWSKCTGFPVEEFTRIYFKKGNKSTKRKNTGALYYGQLRVIINASSTLNRQITGWIQGIVRNCGIV